MDWLTKELIKNAGDSEDKQFEMAVDIFKFFGNIRFVMLPLFFTAMGALFLAYQKTSSLVNDGYLVSVVLVAGIVVSLFFCVYEYAYSKASWRVSRVLPPKLYQLRHNGITWGGFWSTLLAVAYVLVFVFLSYFVSLHYEILESKVNLVVLFVGLVIVFIWFLIILGIFLFIKVIRKPDAVNGSAQGVSAIVDVYVFKNRPYLGGVTISTLFVYFLPAILCSMLLARETVFDYKAAVVFTSQCVDEKSIKVDSYYINNLEIRYLYVDVKQEDLDGLRQKLNHYRGKEIDFVVGDHVYRVPAITRLANPLVVFASFDNKSIDSAKDALINDAGLCGFRNQKSW